MDANNISNRLWVGSKPPFDRDLPKIDVLVLCAAEIQPDRLAFHGQVIRAPMKDAQLSQNELYIALSASKAVSDALVAGKTVLSTCAMGINRSAFIAGLALGQITRRSAKDIISLMRSKRNERCLSNPFFVAYLERFIREERPEVHRKGVTPTTRIVRRR